MRADADFMVYVAARWPSLLRDAVLLGVRPEQAADATIDALARCRRGWERTSRDGDVESLVRAELMAAAARRPRTEEADRELAAQQLLVLAPPSLAELEHQERQRNRATLRRAALVAVPVLLVGAGAGAYFAVQNDAAPHRPHDDSLGNAAVAREENPAPGVVWYADGRLHLAHTVLAIDGLRDMTRVGSGVVYGDDEGRVVHVADDGGREVLGHKDPDVPVAASDENGWAAWVETDGDHPAVEVVEAETGNELLTFPVEADAQVVAVDGDAVYFHEGRDAYYLITRPPGAVTAVPSSVLDVRSRVRVFQVDADHIRVVQPLFNAELDLPGQGAALAPDAQLVVTHQPGGGLEVFDARSGAALPTGLADGDRVVAAVPGDRLTMAYVVAPGDPSPAHDLELRTCDLDGPPTGGSACSVRARIPGTGSTPVLAR